MRYARRSVIGTDSGFVLRACTEARVGLRRDDGAMRAWVLRPFTHRRAVRAIVGFAVLVDVAALTTAFALEIHWRNVGRADLINSGAEWMGVAMIAATAIVGASLMLRRPSHPIGWLFVGLSVSVAITAPIDDYAIQGVVVSPGSLPAASVAAVIGSLTFVPWLVLIALILHVTPTGRPLSRRFAMAMWTTVAAGVTTLAAGVLSDRAIDPPLDHVTNPLAIDPFADTFRVIGAVAITVVGVGVLCGAISLVVRFRRARDVERLQLLWLAIVAIPVVALMAAAFVPGHSRYRFSPLIPTAGIVVLVALGTGLAVERYRLYDVERLLSRTLAYGLLSTLIITVFVSITVIVSALFGRHGDASPIAVAFATLAAVGVAEPGRRRLQDRLDRRFDRRRYTALAVLQRHLDAPLPVADVQAVLREALGDDSLEISYPLGTADADTSQWVTGAGLAATRRAASVDVQRGDRVVARVSYDEHMMSADIATAVLRAAATELDNAGLRAALAVQVLEVQRSRARLAVGQHRERHRIERNLHDGAQQRLLALAMQLQAASVNGSEHRLRDAVDSAIPEVRHAVAELRDLANGLRPTVLTDGGLHGALEDLADRSTFPITVIAEVGALAPDLEETAWFIACEAVANAQKHGNATAIDITVHIQDGVLAIAVHDDGRGGANAEGRGLRGLRDRAEAIGGSLVVRSSPSAGTTIEARLPCES